MNSLSDFAFWEKCSKSLGFKVSRGEYFDEWFDLEEFFCWGLVHVKSDARMFSSLAYFIDETASILAPYKIYKILTKGDIPFHPSILGYFLNLTRKSFKPNQMKKLLSLAKKSDEVFFGAMFFDPRFSEWGKFGFYMNEGAEKYLTLTTLYNNEIIKRRLSGVKPVYSDVFGYLKVNPRASIREIANKTFNDYSTTHKAYTHIEKINLYSA